MITLQELRNHSLKELHNELNLARHNLYKVRSTIVTKKEKNSHKLEEANKLVAQILTIMSELVKSESNSPAIEEKKES